MTRVRNGIRENPEVTKSIESRIGAMIMQQAAITEILALKDTPGWKRFIEDLFEKIAYIDVQFQKFETMSQEARALHLQKRKDWTEIANYMDVKEQELERIGQQIAAARRELKTRQSE